MNKVSIYMCSYNHAAYLYESINSVLNQTYSDFEIFIVDDASTDKSWTIIQSFKDKRIHAIRNETNRNDKVFMKKVMLEMANGDYIAVHHSDNLWEPQKLQKQVDFLDSHPDIGAVFTQALMIDENGDPFHNASDFFYKIFDQPNRTRYEWLNYFFYKGNALSHPSILIRKKCYESCGFYRNGFVQLPDFEMWVRLCLKYEIQVLPEKLIRYRVQSNQMNISGNRRDSRLRGQIEYLQLLDNYRDISTFQELVKVFPTAQKFFRPEGCDIQFILGMIALEAEIGNPVVHLFGLNLLFEVIDDFTRAIRIKQLYGFSRNDFIASTSKLDVFSTEEKSDLYLKLGEKEHSMQILLVQLTEKDQTVQSLTAQVDAKEQSLQALKDQLAQEE